MYEWTRSAGLAMCLLVCSAADAESIYKCTDAGGRISFQGTPCAKAATQATVRIVPPPTPTSREETTRVEVKRDRAPLQPARGIAGRSNPAPPLQRAAPSGATSYMCTADNGKVFYSHSGCPDTLTVGTLSSVSTVGATQRIRDTPVVTRVTTQALSREEACKQINTHSLKNPVSTYDRNAGRDPCG